MMPPPVLSRSVFTAVARISASLGLQKGGNEPEPRGGGGDAAREAHLQTRALLVVDRVDAEWLLSFRAAPGGGHQCVRDATRRIEADRLDLRDARNLDMTTRRLAFGTGRRRTVPGQCLQMLASDPILLADPDCLEPAIADVIPDRK